MDTLLWQELPFVGFNFVQVLDLLEDSCEGLLEKINADHKSS
jgi:hypothetical protein